jgi:DNA-binding response OmpR family regulator
MAKILCVEDEALIRKLVVEELQDEGHQTIEAGNGEEGLTAIVAEKPDLVLCDVNMPVMDGYALLTTLRESHPEFADMPFIFLSAQADREDVIAGQKLGADDYLTKPIDFEMLIISVDTRLNQINRMEEHKQQQMVKLYKAMSEEAPDDVAKPVIDQAAEVVKVSGDDVITVAIVCNEDIDLSPAEDAMIEAGHRVRYFESGSAFRQAIPDLKPDMLLISFDTIDNQAPFVMKILGGKENVDFGSVVFVPPNLKHMCDTTQTSVFDAYVLMPASNEKVLSTIDSVFEERRETLRKDSDKAAAGNAV